MMQRPVSKVIAIASPYGQPVTVTRYVAFTVDASLDDKTTGPHKALWLIGTDSHGKEFIAENDLISGKNVKLSGLLERPAYPAGFLQSKLRDNPFIATWVQVNEMPASSCSASKGDLCCSKGRCGVSQTDINRDLAAPLPEPKQGGQQ